MLQGITEENTNEFFGIVSGGLGKTNDDSNFMFTPLAIHLCHRYTNQIFHGQGTPTKAPQRTMQFLWAMTHYGKGVQDWDKMFVDECRGTLYDSEDRPVSKGDIPMGGMITAIADSFYINYGDLKPAKGEILFNAKGLVKSHCLHSTEPPMI